MKILVPLDGSSLAEGVLPHALTLARACNAHVILLHVLEQEKVHRHSVDPLNWHFRKVEGQRYLHETSGRLQKCGLRADYVLLEGPAAVRIIEYARAHEVNLIILSSYGQSGLRDWGVSSVTGKVMQGAETSILLVRACKQRDRRQVAGRYRRILVPLDGSWRAECGLPLATSLACYSQAKLDLVHVVGWPHLFHPLSATAEDTRVVGQFVERNLAEAARYLEQLRARLTVESETCLLTGHDVTSTLQELVEQRGIDLVLLSAHGYSCDTQRPFGTLVSNFILYGSAPLLIKQDLLPQQMKMTWAERAANVQESIGRRWQATNTHT